MSGYLTYGPQNILWPTFFGFASAAGGAAMYRLIEPHYIFDKYLPADTVVTAGVDVPSNWAPSIAVDPLNQSATSIFWSLGPREVTLATPPSLTEFVGGGKSIRVPITYWKKNLVSPPTWQLTGLGASLPPKSN